MSALVIRPGDRVLVAMHTAHLTQEDAHRLREQLAERLPGVEFTFMAGVAALAKYEE